MMAQDSSDPTGVALVNDTKDTTAVARARERKAAAALALRLSGATFGEIAEVLGYPTARAALVAFETALERELKKPAERQAMRELEAMRLERMLRSVWAKAINENHPEHLTAISRAREIIAQHSKLLGLDAPTELVVHSPTINELEAWVAQVITAKGEVIEEVDILEIEAGDAVQAG
jgi:hypothetical protein